MRTFAATYLISLVTLAVLDGVWLGVLARNRYASSLSRLLRPKPFWPAAAFFYLLHAAGIVVFPVGLAQGVWTAAAMYGALFGACVYAAYDLVNLATLRDWPRSLVVIDFAWGIASSAVASAVVAYAMA